MSNVIGFKAFKNTLKRDSGYAPVSGENGYSVIRCVFPVGDDWDNISAVSAGFFVHPKDIAVVTGTITRDREERAAEFTIPGALLKQGERLHFGLFATVNGVTIATNTVVLDVARGIVSDDIDYDPAEAANMFEQFSNALNTALLGKADKLVDEDYAFTDRILIAGTDGGIKNSHYAINHVSLSGDVNWTVPSSNVVANALAGKADKADAGTDGELAALDANGSPIRSNVSVALSIGEGSNSTVPTTAAVKTALDGKADKAAAGTGGELAAFEVDGALKRSGILVEQSIGAGSNTKVPTTAAVKLVLDGKADKAHTGDFGELAALDGDGALIRSGVSVTQSVDAGSNSTVPTTAAVKTALDGKADKLSGGGGGELVSATGGGEIQRSGFFVSQSIGNGAANMLPTTAAVKQYATDNKPQIMFTGQTVTLNGVLDFYFGDFTGQVLPYGVRISLGDSIFRSSLSPTNNIPYNFNAIASNLLYTGVFKIRKVDVTNLPQEFTDAGSTIYVYHYVTTKTYSNLIRTVTYETADGVKVWNQLVALGGMDASDNVQVTAQTDWTDLTKDSGEVFIVGLTLTSQTGGVMDKTAAQIFEAFNQGKTVILTGTFGDQDISLKVITAAEGTLDETITLTAIAVTEPDGTLFHVYVPRGETNAFALHTYNLNALDGTTFYPSVSSEGVISWTNDGGKQNPAPVNIKGPAGNNYILTPQDKSDIADMVLEMLPPAQIADPALILWDWEGTKLAEYDRATALSLTALPAPGTLAPYAGVDHELLLFQKWNWNLTDIQDWIRAHEGEALDICASYTTLDGQNHNYWDDAITGSADAISVQKRGETTIADSAFQNYYSLRAISIPFGTTAIGGNAFWGCSALKHLGLPSSITILNGGTVRNASSLKTICIPNGVTTIGFGALYACSSLEKIVIPDSVTTISGSAFLGCSALNDLVMSENLSGRIAGILKNCYVLPKFHIKRGVTVIGVDAFANCRTMMDILNESHAANDPSDPAKGGALENVNAFSGLPEGYKIYVPSAKLTWYQNADNWSAIYTDHIVAIEDNLTHLKNLGFNVDAYEEAE